MDITGQRFASAIAVEAADGTLTYAELAERSGHLAQALLAQALTPNQPVGLCAERGRMLTVAMLAILKAGCPVMPLDPALPPGRLAVLIAEGRPQRILAQARCCAALPAEAPVMLIEDTTQAGHQQTTLPASPDGLAYVLFTSGSTGLPKGVAMGRRAFGNVIAWQQRDPVLGRAQRTAQFAALGFDVSFQEMLCCWATGGTLVLVDEDTRRDPHALWQWLAASRIERLYLPVVALQHLAEAAALAPEAGPPLADVIVAGEALVITPKIRALFVRHPCRLHNHYGPTETHVVTFEMLDGDARTWPERPAIGKPLPGCFVRVAGPGGEVVPLGVAGELWLGGAQLAEGYLGRPDLTAERFVSDAEGRRFYRTGDRVRQRPDGNLDYLGRLDDQVKIRGFRVEPGEIAAALGRHPAVAQAAVIADDGQRLVAFVVAAKGENIDAAVLRDHVAKTLPGYMVPAAIVAADALPLTASGKLDRRALRMPAPAPAGPTATEAPRTPTERRLAGLWEEVLGISAIGLHDNFFDLGGHSLLAARLAARIRRELAVELPLRTLFEAPTIAKLAAVLDATATRTPDEAIAPVPRVAEMPCSFAQERLWFLSALEGASATYSMPGVIRLTGTLDLIALQACLSEIVRRHEVLRTRLVERDGHVMQIIDAAAAPPLPLIDLTGQPATAREEAARQWIDGFVQRPFDLARDRPVRFALLRHGPADHVLLVVIHHVAADGWSFGVLAREATALYAAHVGRAVARLSGAAAPLPALPIQYADFAAWQRRRMTGETLQAHRDYWRQQLAGAPARLDLPVARPRPDVQSFHGARLRFALGVEETTRLRDAARHHAVTPHTLLLTAYAAMLHRLSGRDDFIITTPTANRTRPEIEPLIGFFINMLPIRVRLTPGMTFAALIGALHHTMLDALAHQDLPFEKIVEDFSPNRSLAAQTPLTEIVFVLQSWPHVPLELPGLTIAAEPYRDFASKYDLTLSIDDGPGGITGTLEYATDLFDAPAAGQMVEAWRHLLQLLVVTPDAPVLAARLHTPAAPGDDFAFDESPP